LAEELFDVVLQTTGVFPADHNSWETAPPPEDDFPLGADFWIGELPCNVRSDVVFAACEPAGFNFHPARQYGLRYGFCRKINSPGRNVYEWDTERVMGRTLFLSRLIHPTTAERHYSAKLIFRDGELTTIVPGEVQGYGSYVYIVAKQWRDWLSVAEVQQLRDDMGRYIHSAPERLKRARMHIDHAFHAFYLDQRTASLVSSFEGLLKVERHQATAQFKVRVPALAKMVGDVITADEAAILYDDRSTFVHGAQQNYTDVSDELIARYNKFETVLRRALLRASTESTFAALFANDKAVTDTFGNL
jgi:hypothetical protein